MGHHDTVGHCACGLGCVCSTLTPWQHRGHDMGAFVFVPMGVPQPM